MDTLSNYYNNNNNNNNSGISVVESTCNNDIIGWVDMTRHWYLSSAVTCPPPIMIRISR